MNEFDDYEPHQQEAGEGGGIDKKESSSLSPLICSTSSSSSSIHQKTITTTSSTSVSSSSSSIIANEENLRRTTTTLLRNNTTKNNRGATMLATSLVRYRLPRALLQSSRYSSSHRYRRRATRYRFLALVVAVGLFLIAVYAALIVVAGTLMIVFFALNEEEHHQNPPDSSSSIKYRSFEALDLVGGGRIHFLPFIIHNNIINAEEEEDLLQAGRHLSKEDWLFLQETMDERIASEKMADGESDKFKDEIDKEILRLLDLERKDSAAAGGGLKNRVKRSTSAASDAIVGRVHVYSRVEEMNKTKKITAVGCRPAENSGTYFFPLSSLNLNL
jgi:hypothetical protein